MNERRSIGKMPFKQRHQGLCALERREELKLWHTIVSILTFIVNIGLGAAQLIGIIPLVQNLIAGAQAIRTTIWQNDPVDPTNRNRGVNSFTENECWHYFRYRQNDLFRLFALLELPHVMQVNGNKNGTVSGEYAMLIYLHRRHYPENCFEAEKLFGHDYSKLSKVLSTTVDFLYHRHARKVVRNVDWYYDRFDLYNQAVINKIAQVNNGVVPNEFLDVMGFIDGTADEICRPSGHNNVQNSFYNHYYHGHMVINQAVTFPVGLTILDLPEPGFMTDPMVWRDSEVRLRFIIAMQDRLLQGLPPLKLYADKIYITDAIVTAAYSRRYGNLQQWMTDLNNILLKVRVSVEWAFNETRMLFAGGNFKANKKLFLSPVTKMFTLDFLFTNIHICFYGHGQTNEYFDMDPPTPEDYMGQ